VGALAPDPPGARHIPGAFDASGAVDTQDAPADHAPRGTVPPPPDPVVVDSARLRLATLRARAAMEPADQFAETESAQLIDDIRAIGAVLASARSGFSEPPAVLDVGAALVVLCDLRTHVDHLEAGLLDAAERVGLNWDVVAAIIGIPADEAQRRHRQLRERWPSP